MVSLAVLYKFGCDSFTIVAVATDNFTIISESDSSTKLLKKQIHKHWEISDLGPINWLLGMKISHDAKSRTISLCQQSYIELILVCFNLENA
jgi:Reverse transcriptase (RNA-dependent DNA polymerase)